MVRFLHLADVHLDTAFEGRSGALREHLRSALRTSLRRAVECAVDEDVDALLIAGDLFDDDRLSVTTEDFLVEQMERVAAAGITVVYVTGNHDPGGRDFRAARIDWPNGVHYVDTRTPTRIPVTDSDGADQAVVVAAGHASPREQENLAAGFPDPEGELPHIGLLHAHVTSARQVEAHDRYAPCSVDDLRARDYAYWALGHVHTRQRVCQDPTAWYPGNVQGRTPRETGARGGLLVTLRAGGEVDVEFRPFAPMRWEHVTLDDLEGVDTVRALVRRLRGAFEETAGEANVSDWLLRVDLEGPCPLAEELTDADAVEELEDVAAQRLDVLDVEIRTRQLTPPVNVETFRGETHLAGEVLSMLDRVRADDALLDEVAPNVLAGVSTDDDEVRRAYLRSLLEGLEREAVARLISEEGRAG